MRLLRAAALPLLLLALPALSAAQGRNVAGTYKVAVNSPQGAVNAVVTVTRTNGAYGGTLAADGFPTIPITHVETSDTGFVAHADAGGEMVMLNARFNGADKVRGTLNYQGADMSMEGTYTPDGAVAGGALNPVARYTGKTLDPFMGAAEFQFVCDISKAGDKFGGGCGPSADQLNEAPIESVTVTGNEVTFTGGSPMGPYNGKMTVTGTTFTGTLTLGGETARIQGTITPAAR
jgi:hypothetical protein